MPFRFDGDLPHIVTRRRTLPCGLEVLVHADDSAPQVAVSMWYRVGSADEPGHRTGLAHLFEHLFKSPATHLGGHHHYDVLRRAGASDANASTTIDRTAYYEVLPAHELSLALWLEASRMGYFATGFDPERLATQQSVVRAERRQRYEDVPYGAERFAIAQALYPDGHPLRHLTIGRHDDIQATTYEDILTFYRTWYVPANATLVIAGDVPPDDVDQLVDRYFGGYPASRRPPRTPGPVVTQARTADRVVDRFAALTRIHRAWHAPPALSDDEPTLDILATAWSTVGTGALWRRLVYESQLAQRVSAWTTHGRIGGEVHVAVDLRTGADPAAVRAILDEECARGIDELAIDRVVTRREAGVIWSLAQLVRRTNIVQRSMLYADRPDALADELVRYRAVTPAAIDAAIQRWLAPSGMVEIETVPGGAATAPASGLSAS